MWTDSIPENAVIIDLRSKESFDEWHKEGSLNLQLEEAVKKVSSGELDKEKEYIIVCYTGMKTTPLLNVMNRYGYKAKGLIGGISTLMTIEGVKRN